jgi:hypothetical protein
VDWLSLNEVTAKSGVVICGKIEVISEASISSIKANSEVGTLDLAYFRVIKIWVGEMTFPLTVRAPSSGSTVEAMLLGAGPNFPVERSCYALDRTQYPGQLPLV